MNTKTIKDLLEIKFGYKEKYTLEELNMVEILTINRFNYNKNLIEVDFNDLKFFLNLKELTINECIIDNEIINILSNCINLRTLLLLNCEIIQNVNETFKNLSVKNLVINNTNIDINILNNLNLNSLVLSNIEINYKLNLNVEELDIQRCLFNDIENFNIDSINKIKISYSQYKKYQNYLDSYKDKLIIMEDNGQFIYKERGE